MLNEAPENHNTFMLKRKRKTEEKKKQKKRKMEKREKHTRNFPDNRHKDESTQSTSMPEEVLGIEIQSLIQPLFSLTLCFSPSAFLRVLFFTFCLSSSSAFSPSAFLRFLYFHLLPFFRRARAPRPARSPEIIPKPGIPVPGSSSASSATFGRSLYVS